MEDPQRIVFAGPVVSERQIHFIHFIPASRDGRDRVVRFPFRLRVDPDRRIRIPAPFREDPVRQGDEPVLIRAAQPDHRNRPVKNSPSHPDSRRRKPLFDRRILHRESAAAALEMLVGEDGPAYDGQIRIASDE